MSNEIQVIKNEIGLLKKFTNKLAQANNLTNEVIEELAVGIIDDIKVQIKEEMTTYKEEVKGEIIETIGDNIKQTVKDEVNKRGLNGREIAILKNERNKRFIRLLGSPKSDLYILLMPFYQSQMKKEYKKLFNCDVYADVQADRFEEAIKYIENFTVTPEYYEWCIKTLHKNYQSNEIESNKKLNAYKRFFGIID